MKLETRLRAEAAAFQGGDTIIVLAPVESVWPLIADSGQLKHWGPPVREVTNIDQPEGLGSRRTVIAEFTKSGGVITTDASAVATDKQAARFVERRIEHVEGRKVGYRIEEENVGMSRFITEVGYTTELERLGPNETRVTWNFYHNPRGLLGAVMNVLFIKQQQRRNRLGALLALKLYAEGRL